MCGLTRQTWLSDISTVFTVARIPTFFLTNKILVCSALFITIRFNDLMKSMQCNIRLLNRIVQIDLYHRYRAPYVRYWSRIVPF